MDQHIIMVVEDDDDIRSTLCELIESQGYVVIAADNGQNALDTLRGAVAAGRRVCVILLDLMMPVMDGWKFREQQRADPALAAIPVVVITASGHDSSALGNIDVLKKPLRFDAVMGELRKRCPLT